MNGVWTEHVSREQTALEAQYVLPFIPSAHSTAGRSGDFSSFNFSLFIYFDT